MRAIKTPSKEEVKELNKQHIESLKIVKKEIESMLIVPSIMALKIKTTN
ncbi:hypothetical protein [Sulfurimonas sp.]